MSPVSPVLHTEVTAIFASFFFTSASTSCKNVHKPPKIEIYVTGGRFDRTRPLACPSPFPVWCWIRSDFCSSLWDQYSLLLKNEILKKLVTSLPAFGVRSTQMLVKIRNSPILALVYYCLLRGDFSTQYYHMLSSRGGLEVERPLLIQ